MANTFHKYKNELMVIVYVANTSGLEYIYSVPKKVLTLVYVMPVFQ